MQNRLAELSVEKLESNLLKMRADPVLWASQVLGWDAHPGQAKWLRNSIQDENYLATGNRWGKTEVNAIDHLHSNFFQIRNRKWSGKPYKTCNMAISLDIAAVCHKKALALAEPISWFIERDKLTPFPEIQFKNGSVFTSRSSKNKAEYLLSHEYDLVTFDEVAFEPFAEYIFNQVLSLRVADRAGILKFTSTPKGTNNWYGQRAQRALNDKLAYSYAQQGDSRDNPNIALKYLERRISKFTDKQIEQNIKGQILTPEDTRFDWESIQKLFDDDKVELIDKPIEGRKYCHGWDLAKQRAYTVGVTLDVTTVPFQIVHFDKFTGKGWPYIIRKIEDRANLFGGETVIDATGVGDVVLDFTSKSISGFTYQGKRKRLLSNLELALEFESVKSPFLSQEQPDGERWTFFDELQFFDESTTESYDTTHALALALWPRRKQIRREPSSVSDVIINHSRKEIEQALFSDAQYNRVFNHLS